MEALINVILVTGINVVLLSLFLLVSKKDKSIQHLILIVIYTFFGFVTIDAFLGFHQLNSIQNISFLFADTIGFFIGPTLLIYITSIFRSEKFSPRYFWFHYIPFCIYGLFVSLPSLLNRLGFDNSGYIDQVHEHHFIFNIQGFYLLGYLVISLVFLNLKRKRLNDHFSNLDTNNLNWIYYLLIGFVAIMSFYLGSGIIESLFDFEIQALGIYTTMLLMIMLGFLCYYGLSQTDIFLPKELVSKSIWPRESPENKSQLSLEDTQYIENIFHEYFAINKPHLDANLNLTQLAEGLQISSKKLTVYLNQHLGMSFYEFVNEKRVHEFKKLLDSGKHKEFTLLALAKESGFNSKSSFNRIFKRSTGTTPKQYLERL